MTIVVTGGGSGIGLATAQLAEKRRIRVAVLDLGAGAWHGDFWTVDVNDRAGVHEATHAAARKLGPVTALVTCAGIAPPTDIRQVSTTELQRVFEINVYGAVYAIQAAAELMRAEGGGSIVTLSSVAAHRGGGLLGGAPYAASKSAVLGLTRAAARELADDGIRVNCVAPGPVDTPIHRGNDVENFAGSTLLDRVADPTEVAESVLFLLGSAGANITGETLNVNGGAHFS